MNITEGFKMNDNSVQIIPMLDGANDLVLADEARALKAYTSSGLDEVIEEAKDFVSAFKHDLTTDAGRKRTKSLGRKVSTLKVTLDKLGLSLTDEWAKKKKAVDSSRKIMRDTLDELKVEALKPVVEWQAEQDKIAAEKAKEQLDKLRHERISRDHELSILMNDAFDRAESERLEKEKRDEIAKQDKIKLENEIRDKQIAEEAAIIAEAAAKEKIDEARAREETAKMAAQDSERLRIAATERAKIEAEHAELRRAEAEKQAVSDAKIAAENARLAEIARQEKIAEDEAKALAKRESNKRHIGTVRRGAKESLMDIGLTEEMAKEVVMCIHKGHVKNVTINY